MNGSLAPKWLKQESTIPIFGITQQPPFFQFFVHIDLSRDMFTMDVPFRPFYRSLEFFFVRRNIKEKIRIVLGEVTSVKRASPSSLKIEQSYPPDRSLSNGWRGLRTDINPPDCHLTDRCRYPAFEQLVPVIDH